jgi:RNA recognition motif-containing protein
MYEIFIGGIHPKTTPEDIFNHFSNFGPIKGYKVMAAKGYAFLTYHKSDQHDFKNKAVDCQAQGYKHIINGNVLDVRLALSKE